MRVLVVGENGKDVFVKGKCLRLCPEAPVPVFNPISQTSTRGMAGNVACNIISLGGEAFQVDFLSNQQDIVKTRYVDTATGYIVLRVDENDRVEQPLTFGEFVLAAEQTRSEAIVISDYNKGYLTEEVIGKIGKWAANKQIPVFLDTKKTLGSWSEGMIVKINEKEFLGLQKNLPHPEDYCRLLIVTLGERGAMIVRRDGNLIIESNYAVKVSDVSGAGDTYLAQLVVGFLESGNIKGAMESANKAASIAVSMPGVVAVERRLVV